MALYRSPPRHPVRTREAARNREEQRRFDLMTVTWTEDQLRQACKVLGIGHDDLTVDQMQTALVASQVHRLDDDAGDESSDGRPSDGKPFDGNPFSWPDPHKLFG